MLGQAKVIDSTNYRLRHVGLAADLYPSGGAPSATALLSQSLVPRPLAGEWVNGDWTGRINDAGEFNITFPNAGASDGAPWRARFKSDGLIQFLEILSNDDLEFVGVITKIVPTLQSVTISGFDGWQLLRRAYERDRQVAMAPRDVIEDYSMAPVMDSIDDFLGNALAGNWTASGTTSVSNGLLHIAQSGVGTSQVVNSISSPCGWGKRFTIVAQINVLSFLPALFTTAIALDLTFSPGPAGITSLNFESTGNRARFFGTYGGTAINLQIPWQIGTVPGRHTLMIESDGRWLRGSIDGKVVGYIPLDKATITANSVVTATIRGQGTDPSSRAIFDVDVFYQRAVKGFLMRGASKGDYVLPGTASTYPSGGLHAYYWNDGDLLSLAAAVYPGYLMRPNRSVAIERLDAQINSLAPPSPQCDTAYFSVRWTGAIYLPLATVPGTWTVSLVGLDDGARVWVGKTRMGDQLIDDWNAAGPRTVNGTFADTALGSKNGWYPIVVEYFNNIGTGAIALKFTPPGAGSYVDPGGTTITLGTQIVVPSTSLSPLGCVTSRIQGQSFFDIVQKTLKDFGYQASVQPRALESGVFPGELLPVGRVGQDYDLTIEPDTSDARNGAIDYQSTIDGSDQAGSIRGNGAGAQTGDQGQVQTEVIAVATIKAQLFELQAWQDASEIGDPTLVANRLQSELGLHLSPWQEVAATPKAFPQLAGAFPVVIPPALSAMRWRPGDGVRLLLPDVNIIDAAPRQIMQFTRQFVPTGRTGNQAAFRNRPKSRDAAVREGFFGVTRLQRAYQTTLVTLETQFVDDVAVAGGAFGNYVMLHLGNERVQKAVARMYSGTAMAANGFDLEINGVLRGSALGGPWGIGTTAFNQVEVDITPYARNAGYENSTLDPRLYCRLKNLTAAGADLSLQVILTVLR